MSPQGLPFVQILQHLLSLARSVSSNARIDHLPESGGQREGMEMTRGSGPVLARRAAVFASLSGLTDEATRLVIRYLQQSSGGSSR